MRQFLPCLSLLAAFLVSQPAHSLPSETATISARRPALVAVIDSGIAGTPELRDSLTGEFDVSATPARAPFQPRYDHGTMVATILKREVKTPIRIVSVRIDDPAGCPAQGVPPCQPDVAVVAQAIHKAVDLGVDAINISLSMREDPMIVAAVRDATERGIIVVLAAGNEGRDRPGNLAMAEAGFPNAILVGALDADGHPWLGTNRPDAGIRDYRYVWQRGVAVPTTLASGDTATGTGTSFATPIETAREIDARWQQQAPGRSIAAR